MQNSSFPSSLVRSNLRKISNSNSECINGRPGAAMLLFHLCYCSFKQGEMFWNRLQDRNSSILAIIDGVKLPCSLKEFYGEYFDEIAQMQCYNLEIAAELKKQIIHNPSSVADIIISDLKDRGNGVALHSMRKGLAELCAYIIGKNECQSIFNPFAGISDIECAAHSSTAKFHSFYFNPRAQAIASMRLEMCGKENVVMETAQNPIEFVSHHKGDSIFLFPPLGMTASGANASRLEKTWIEEYLHTSGAAKCFAIVTPGFGFRNDYKELRRDLLHRGLTAVIELPKGEIPGNHIAPYLLVIEKDKRPDTVKFVSMQHCVETTGRSQVFHLEEAIATLEGRNSFSKEVSVGEILNSDGLRLTPGRFLLETVLPHREGHTPYRLSDLLTPITTELCRQNLNNDRKTVGTKDLSNTYDYMNKGVIPTAYPTEICQRLETEAILLSHTSDALKMGLAKGVSHRTPLFLNRVISPYAVKPGVDVDFLLTELSSDYVRKQIALLFPPTSLPPAPSSLSYVLDEILLLLPSLEEQKAHVAQKRQQLIADLGGALHSAEKDFRRDVHMKRHAMGQTIGAIQNWWSILEKSINPGSNSLDGTAPGNGSAFTLDQVVKNVRDNLRRLSIQIDRFDRGYKYHPQRLMLRSAIMDYTATHTTPVFAYDIDMDKEYSNVAVFFPKEVLYMILNNIMSNASSHGFLNRANPDNIVRIQLWTTADTVTVSIANNGLPCAPDMTPLKITSYGETSDIQAHCGIGGYEAKFLMNEFNQDLEIHLNKDAEFPVEYQLIFKTLDNE